MVGRKRVERVLPRFQMLKKIIILTVGITLAQFSLVLLAGGGGGHGGGGHGGGQGGCGGGSWRGGGWGAGSWGWGCGGGGRGWGRACGYWGSPYWWDYGSSLIIDTRPVVAVPQQHFPSRYQQSPEITITEDGTCLLFRDGQFFIFTPNGFVPASTLDKATAASIAPSPPPVSKSTSAAAAKKAPSPTKKSAEK